MLFRRVLFGCILLCMVSVSVGAFSAFGATQPPDGTPFNTLWGGYFAKTLINSSNGQDTNLLDLDGINTAQFPTISFHNAYDSSGTLLIFASQGNPDSPVIVKDINTDEILSTFPGDLDGDPRTSIGLFRIVALKKDQQVTVCIQDSSYSGRDYYPIELHYLPDSTSGISDFDWFLVALNRDYKRSYIASIIENLTLTNNIHSTALKAVKYVSIADAVLTLGTSSLIPDPSDATKLIHDPNFLKGFGDYTSFIAGNQKAIACSEQDLALSYTTKLITAAEALSQITTNPLAAYSEIASNFAEATAWVIGIFKLREPERGINAQILVNKILRNQVNTNNFYQYQDAQVSYLASEYAEYTDSQCDWFADMAGCGLDNYDEETVVSLYNNAWDLINGWTSELKQISNAYPDADRDGISNQEELLNGTDPNDPNDPTPAIQLTSPALAMTKTPGGSVSIAWNAAYLGSSDTVQVELIGPGSSSSLVLDDSAAHSGSMTYAFPNDATLGVYTIKVSSNNNAALRRTSPPITLVAQTPNLNIEQPAGTTVVPGSTQDISWDWNTGKYPGSSYTVGIALHKGSTSGSGTFVSWISSSISIGSGGFSWSVPVGTLTPGSDYFLKAVIYDSENNIQESLAGPHFTIVEGPAINLTFPTEGTHLEAGRQYQLQWTTELLDSSESVTLKLTPNVGSAHYILEDGPNTGSYYFTIPLDTADGETYLRASVGSSIQQEIRFQIDNKRTIVALADATQGSVSPSGEQPVPYLGSQTFTITPADYHNIKDILVDGISQGAQTSYTFTNIERNHFLTALFEPVKREVTVATTGSGQGTVTLSPDFELKTGTDNVYLVPYGSNFTATAVPNANSLFTEWTTPNSYTGNPRILSLSSGDMTVTASFTKDTDGDGMSDDYESANGLNPNSAADRTADPDNDRLPNWLEQALGSNPQAGQSVVSGMLDYNQIMPPVSVSSTGGTMVDADGNLWAWGQWFQGVATVPPAYYPARWLPASCGNVQWKASAVSYNFWAGITADGVLWCGTPWGEQYQVPNKTFLAFSFQGTSQYTLVAVTMDGDMYKYSIDNVGRLTELYKYPEGNWMFASCNDSGEQTLFLRAGKTGFFIQPHSIESKLVRPWTGTVTDIDAETGLQHIDSGITYKSAQSYRGESQILQRADNTFDLNRRQGITAIDGAVSVAAYPYAVINDQKQLLIEDSVTGNIVQADTSVLFEQVWGTGDINIALSTAGDYYSWGRNDGSRLGQGISPFLIAPTRVEGFSGGLKQMKSISGLSFFVENQAGKWFSFGVNTGNLGIGHTHDTVAVEQFSGLNVLDIAFDHRAIVVTDAGTTMYDYDTSLGSFSSNDIAKIFSDSITYLTISPDGTLYEQNSAEGARTLVDTNVDTVKMVPGTYYAYLKKNGTLWVKGNCAPLGDLYSTPVQVGSFSDWKDFDCGSSLLAGIRADGSIWGVTDASSTPYFPPTAANTLTRFGTGTDWKSLAVSYRYLLAVTTGGTLWGCGVPDSYQSLSKTASTEFTLLDSARNWAGVEGLYGACFGHKTDGTLWRWGKESIATKTPGEMLFDDTDTDNDLLSDAAEAARGTDPNDTDSDDDGLPDGVEVLFIGTNPLDADTDHDGIQDGTEYGLTLEGVGADTDRSVFVPDADPSTTTNPLAADTNGDGTSDGDCDTNHNGSVDAGEKDPLTVYEPQPQTNYVPAVMLILGN